ncbi:cation:proton antiporter [Candidatus Microgenomates bacterium]|nr:cation:proton antiporter [Candidatus Microgenomates bacterium]
MTDSNVLFIQLALILGLSSLLGYAVHLLKLPLLVAYIIAGLFLSPFHIFSVHTGGALTLLPEIGIAFVLFFVGMELVLSELKSLGRPIIVAAFGQIVISSSFGFLFARFFGFPPLEALILGFGLSVSSTIVVIKLLLEKKDLTSLYGKLSLGILLVEDLVAVALLMVMTTGSSFLNVGISNVMPLLALSLKGVVLLILAITLSRFALTRIFVSVAHSTELLFLSALAWCFVFIATALFLGFSVIIGAFLAGVAIASSPFHFEIQAKLKPLRDFFVALFFVYLGSQVVFQDLPRVLPLIIVFTLFALVVKPLLFMSILSLFGFRKHTLFQTSLNLSQISEFSLVIAVVGVTLGIVSQSVLTAIALTGVFSVIFSSIMIASARQIYSRLSAVAAFFERGDIAHEIEAKREHHVLEDHIVLIGAHRLGAAILTFLVKERVPFIIVDFNPKIIRELQDKGLYAIYGDIGDPEIVELLNLSKAKLIISTARDREDNLMLLAYIARARIKAPVIARASTVEDLKVLYKKGADYVILPEAIAGDVIKEKLRTYWDRLGFFKDRAKIELDKLDGTLATK